MKGEGSTGIFAGPSLASALIVSYHVHAQEETEGRRRPRRQRVGRTAPAGPTRARPRSVLHFVTPSSYSRTTAPSLVPFGEALGKDPIHALRSIGRRLGGTCDARSSD
jgi:hypothetical protein